MIEDVTPWFGRWFSEHFDVVGGYPPEARCRRCGMTVGYPTKHAAVRHGDPIRILPIASEKLGIISLANAF